MQQFKTATDYLKPERSHLASDLIAGLTFAVVNVPQAMAHALLAMVYPVYGIYTLMIAVPIGAIFASSVFMNVSTTGALSVAAGAGLTYIPASQRLEGLAVLVLLVGVMQVLAGLFRLGFLIRFVSNAVMTGFLNGVAVLIILGQLGHLTGYTSRFSNNLLRSVDLILNVGQVSVPATIIGLLTLVGIVLLLRTRLRKFAFIITIAAATILLALLTLPALPTAASFDTVITVGEIATIPRSLPRLVLPSPSLVAGLLLPALSVAIIGLIQGAGVSQSMPNPDGRYPNVSRDFLGQGVANMATSFVGGVPAGGSISGTVLIKGAGAKSRWTNIFAGVFVAIIVLLAAPLVEQVPMPALAALLIMAGFQGLRVEQAVITWNTSRVAGAVMVITFVATLVVPLQFAVLFGVALTIVLHVFRQSNKVVVTQWELQPGGFPIEVAAPAQLPSNRFTFLHINGSLFFAAAKSIEEMLPKVEQARHAVVGIGLRGQSEIGSTFITVLRRYAEALKARDGRLMLVGVSSEIRDQLANTGVLKLIGEENVFIATPQLGVAMNQAVAAAHAWLEQQPRSASAGTDSPPM